MTREALFIVESSQAAVVSKFCSDAIGWADGQDPIRRYIEAVTNIEKVAGLALLASHRALKTYPVIPIGFGQTWEGWEPYKQARLQDDQLQESAKNTRIVITSDIYTPSTDIVSDFYNDLEERINVPGWRGFLVIPIKFANIIPSPQPSPAREEGD